MYNIKKITSAFDNEIISKNKEYLSLAQAHRVLISKDLMTVGEIADGNFKELLESNQIKSAYQTNTSPKQWRIEISIAGQSRKSKIKIENFEDNVETYEPIVHSSGAFQSNNGKPLVSGIGWFVIIITVLIVGYVINAKEHPNDDEQIVYNGPDGEVYQVVNYLKQNYLQDPDSYQSIEWSELTKGSQKYMVRHKFRAKNGFGGYVVENKIFYLNLEGEVIEVLDY